MKIILNDKAYVQQIDLAHLPKFNGPIPVKVFESVYGNIFICVPSNQYDFTEFTDPDVVEFFKNWHHSIDMVQMQAFTDDEIDTQIYSLIDKYNEIAHQFNEMSDEEKSNNFNMYEECELIDFQIGSLHEFKGYRAGKLKFSLPKEARKTVKKETPWQKILKRFDQKKI